MGRFKGCHGWNRKGLLSMDNDNKTNTEIIGGTEYKFMPLGDYIVRVGGVCGGRPVFKGAHIPVSQIIHRFIWGESVTTLAKEHKLPQAAIREAIALIRELGLVELAKISIKR